MREMHSRGLASEGDEGSLRNCIFGGICTMQYSGVDRSALRSSNQNKAVEAVRLYHGDGNFCVLVTPGEKGPRLKFCQPLRISPEEAVA